MTSSSAHRAPTAAVFISGAIGDNVVHMGLVKRLALRHGPVLLINYLDDQANALFADQPCIGRVISLRSVLGPDRQRRSAMAAELFAAAKLEHLYHFNFETWFALAALKARVPNRYAYLPRRAFIRLPLFSHHVFVPDHTPHPRSYYWIQDLLRKYAFDHAPIWPNIDTSPSFVAQARQLVAARPRWVALGMSSSVAVRQWGGARYAGLARAIQQVHPDIGFILFGHRDIAPVADEFLARMPAGTAVVNLPAIAPDLRLSVALLADAQLYVGNDSSGMNLAAAVGIPTIGLFGYRSLSAFCAHLQPIYAQPPESGMANIAADEVARLTLKLLAAAD